MRLLLGQCQWLDVSLKFPDSYIYIGVERLCSGSFTQCQKKKKKTEVPEFLNFILASCMLFNLYSVKSQENRKGSSKNVCCTCSESFYANETRSLTYCTDWFNVYLPLMFVYMCLTQMYHINWNIGLPGTQANPVTFKGKKNWTEKCQNIHFYLRIARPSSKLQSVYPFSYEESTYKQHKSHSSKLSPLSSDDDCFLLSASHRRLSSVPTLKSIADRAIFWNAKLTLRNHVAIGLRKL